MVILLLTIILSIILGILIFYFRKSEKDLFSPTVIAIFMIFITNVPYLLSIAYDYNVIHYLVRWRIPDNELDVYIFKYIAILLLGVFGLILGIKGNLGGIINSKLPLLFKENSNKNNYIPMLIALFIGFLAYVYFIYSAGGLNIWLENLYQRASVTSGNGYILSLMGLLNIGVFIYIYSFRNKKSFFKLFLLILLAIGVSLVLTSLGGRKPTLQFLVLCFLIWHFSVKSFSRIPVKALFLVPVLVIYIILIPILRAENGVEDFINDPTIISDGIIEETSSVAKSLSYIDHYLLIIDHFSLDNIWLGKSFVDLVYSPIPSSLYPDKPPVDDGAYLRTIAEGVDVTPSRPFNELYPSSWPPETLGNMYMNFWIPGVFVGMYILGVIYKTSYLYMRKSNYGLISILIYGHILLNFQLSNLRIVQTLTDLLVIIIFISVLFTLNNIKTRRN